MKNARGLDRIVYLLPSELAHALMMRSLPWTLLPNTLPKRPCSATWGCIRLIPWVLWPVAFPWIAVRAVVDWIKG